MIHPQRLAFCHLDWLQKDDTGDNVAPITVPLTGNHSGLLVMQSVPHARHGLVLLNLTFVSELTKP